MRGVSALLTRDRENIRGYEEVENEALGLPEEERAELAQELLLSLDSPSEEEIAEDWLLEAHRRARELNDGTVQPISAEEVRREAQALLR